MLYNLSTRHTVSLSATFRGTPRTQRVTVITSHSLAKSRKWLEDRPWSEDVTLKTSVHSTAWIGSYSKGRRTRKLAVYSAMVCDVESDSGAPSGPWTTAFYIPTTWPNTTERPLPNQLFTLQSSSYPTTTNSPVYTPTLRTEKKDRCWYISV